MKKSDPIYALVKHASNIKIDNIPAEVLNKTIDLFLDTIGCILSGSSAAGIRELKNTIMYWGGREQSKIFCFDEKTNPPFAAFLNAVMGHANDFDDTHDKALNHGCVVIVPALLSVCEALSSEECHLPPGSIPSYPISGADFIASMAVGLDIACRLGMAFIPYLHTGWLPTTLWGPFGCAASCGRLFNFDEEKMGHAFGLAYSQINGNRQALIDGALAKRIQPGFSASAGVQSVFFASNNITGAENIINGDFGIRALYTSGNFDSDCLTDNLGTSFETDQISIKPYPCCRCTHPVIDAALSIRQEHTIKWQDIVEGTIYLPPVSMGQIGKRFHVRENPTVDAQFSAQYTAALTFIEGKPKLDSFRRESVVSKREVIKLASLFKVIEFEKEVSGFTPVEIEIKLENGDQHYLRVENLKGSPSNPMTREEILLKFNDCLDNSIKSYSDEDRERIVQTVNNILTLKNMSELIKLL